jgi:pimeloyl-ACP methyl ester carboxylesterase
MVAPLLAQQAPAPQGIVTYGASAIPIVEGLIGALERYAALRNTTQPESAAWLDGSKPPAVTTAFVAQQSELLRWVVAGKLTPREALAQLPELKSARPDHFTDDTIYRRNVRFYHQLQTAPLEASWRNCPCPLLALHGARDWVTSLEDSQRLAALVSLGGVVKSDVVQVYADHQMADPNLVKNRVELEAAAIVPELASLRLAPGLCELVSDWIAAL